MIYQAISIAALTMLTSCAGIPFLCQVAEEVVEDTIQIIDNCAAHIEQLPVYRSGDIPSPIYK
jgi:hypothetical protein